jgi:hypothetical protein
MAMLCGPDKGPVSMSRHKFDFKTEVISFGNLRVIIVPEAATFQKSLDAEQPHHYKMMGLI